MAGARTLRGRAALMACGVVAALAGGAPPALAVFEPLEPSAPVPPSVVAALQRVQSKPLYDHATWGVHVADARTGETLVAQNTGRLFTPGSIMKTYSTATALDLYGPSYRFRTPVFRTGNVTRGRLDGNLVLVASGDFSFGLRDRPDGSLAYNSFPQVDHNYADTGLPGPTIVRGSNPLAGVEQLARQVRAAGIRRVDGDVVIDDRLFETYNGFPDGLISPIWLNENVIDIFATPTRAGRAARVDYRPKTAQWRVRSRVTTGPRGSEGALQARQVAPGVIEVTGRVPAGGGRVLQIFQVPDPAAFARSAFIEALERRGVAVEAPATGGNPDNLLPRRRSYPASRRVALRVSPELRQYTKVILKVSYNRGADLMTCLAAARAGSRNCEDGLLAELRNNTRLGVPLGTTFPFDGAGSDDRARTSPAAMTAFLRNIRGRPYGAALRDGLPIVGVDGTLATSGRGTPAQGRVQAKTGNRVGFLTASYGIEGGQTQVGYIDAASGRTLVFAVLTANIPLTDPEQINPIADDQVDIAAAIQPAY